MADDVRVIDIKLAGLDENIKNMIELQKYTKQTADAIKAFEKAEADVLKLQKSLDSLEKTGKKNTDEYKKAEAELQKLQGVIKANTSEYLNNIKVQVENKQLLQDQKREVAELIKVQNKQTGSIVELREQGKLLQREYINLSRMQREGLEGKALQDSLRATREEINKASMAAGDYRTNVGNYANSILDASNKMGGFGKVAQTMKGGLDTIKLASSGALGVFGLIVFAIQQLYEVFAKTKAMETFRAILEGLKNVMFDAITILTSWWKTLYSIVTLDFSGVVDNLTTMFDTAKGIGDSFTDAYEAQKEMYAIEQKRNSLMKIQQDRQNEIDVLMKRTSARSKLDDQEKLKALKKAGDLQRQTTKENIELKQREIDAFKKANADEMKGAANSIELQAELAKMETDLSKMRGEEANLKADILNREEMALEGIAQKEKELQKQREEANKKRLEAIKQRQQTEFEIRRLTLDFEKDLQKKETDILKLEYEKRIVEIQNNEKLIASEKTKLKELAELDWQKKQEELDKKFNEDAFKKLLEQQQKLVALKLSALKNDSEAELMLKLQALDLQKQAELQSVTETSEEAKLIRQKYANLTAEAILADDKANAQKLANQKIDNLKAELLALDITEKQQYELNKQLLQERFLADMEQKKLNNESTVLLEAEFKAKLAELDKQELDRQAMQAQTKIELTKTVAGAFSELISAMDGQSEASANFAKAVGLFQIGIDTAMALSAVVASSAKTAVTPATIPMQIATGTAIVLSNIAKATKLLNQQKAPKKKYAEGGAVIEGASHSQGGVTFTGDNGQVFEAEGNEAMFILNKRSTKALGLLDKMNSFKGFGGGNSNNTYFENGGNLQIAKADNNTNMQLELMAQALKEMPAPQVAVTEILSGANNYAKVIETSNI